jgi:hypothetical protein
LKGTLLLLLNVQQDWKEGAQVIVTLLLAGVGVGPRGFECDLGPGSIARDFVDDHDVNVCVDDSRNINTMMMMCG